jgi:formylglycine-generating enzyme required for sulfatase activity
MAQHENPINSTTEEANIQYFRIFLASPGDVPLERKLAREAIAHIGSERRFRSCIKIEIVAWDQPGAAVAMEAGLTPQDAIAQGLPKPEDCDLAVVILWSRIGTQLPGDFDLKPDGTPYLSGTEWEYLNALKGFRANRRPAVWVYRRNGAPNPDLDDPNYDSIVQQWSKLKQFFAAFTNPDGTLAGGINPYETPDNFRQQFEHHLRDRLDKLLETLPIPISSQITAKPITTPPRWPDSPYPGLEAFTPEQAPIYFGRGREVDQLLQQFADAKTRFVAVVGVSGSGKSSLVKAGLLPRLRAGIIGNAPWIDLIFKPGERGDNPYLALSFAVRAELNLSGPETEIANAIQADANVAKDHLTKLLARNPHVGELLLVIDQFEELFTQCKDDYLQDFLSLLDELVALPRLRLIATLRADFYPRAIAEPNLANLLRQDRGTFPLDPPSISAILQMIIRPAEAAGIELQEELASRLLDDAGGGPGAMAIIAFTLSQLYEQDKSSPTINLKAYDDFGGVKGAIQKRAEAALQGLKIDLDSELPKLFTLLVEVNEQEIATRRRVTKAQLCGDAKILADRLIPARLLVGGDDKEPMIEVAHETVLTGWDRLHLWILDNAVALRTRRDLEQVANEWDKSQRPASALRTGAMLKNYLNAAQPRSDVAQDYLKACKTRRNWFRVGYALASLLFIASVDVLYQMNNSDYPPKLVAKAMLVNLGILSVSTPDMVKIQAGQFEMGAVPESNQPNEHPVHTVEFSGPFEMGKFEVTFAEYDLFVASYNLVATRKIAKPNDENFGRDDRPVINVSWDDAMAYALWLSEHTGLNYRLPTEAEWEYAARAATTSERYWSEKAEADQDDPACAYANVFDAYNESTIKNRYGGISWEAFKCPDKFPYSAPVGQFKANPWKLHDMLGNVWEWTQDCYVDSYEHTPSDGSAQESLDNTACPLRVLRGGSWDGGPQIVRSAYRFRGAPDYRFTNIGFRLARTL